MITICLVGISIFYVVVKLTLYFIVKKYGKFTYDGLSVAGFEYNSKDDLFASTKNAWQKNFGYGHLYDVLAPFGNMIIDTEAIHFNYNGLNYLISFWKGQYGICIGAEVGIYVTHESKVNKKTIYLPSEDMLDMSFILYKNHERVISIDDKHWWLAAFKLGRFSNPRDLQMDINITFPNEEFLAKFISGFERLGYKKRDYSIIGNTFIFTFRKPKTKRVFTRNFIYDHMVQKVNKGNVLLYNKYLSDYIDANGKYDKNKKYIYLKDFIPIKESNVKVVLGDEDD